MAEAKLRRAEALARLKRASRGELLRECASSGLTQDELGALIGTDARGVRRLQRKGRVRADRLDLMVALQNLSPSLQRRETVSVNTVDVVQLGLTSPARTSKPEARDGVEAEDAPSPADAMAKRVGRQLLSDPSVASDRSLLRVGESASHLAHNQEIPRSTRGPATNKEAA